MNTEINEVNKNKAYPERSSGLNRPGINTGYTKDKLQKIIEEKLSIYYNLTCENAGPEHFYKALAVLTRDMLSEKRRDSRSKTKSKRMKTIYYLCMEFLVGKQLKNNIYNLCIENELEEIMNDYGHTLEEVYEKDVDPGLGNGGLGRLAACFMDS
ncbi:MAG: glycogen/starch/alpha-glucan phosphorylase, partial [Oscillospiraceae bacterium]|nr:glycogen/starch/alpha-glucan phosphorylase [Oscillospiraceae bacterium]